MMKLLLTYFACACCISIQAQNLIPNGGFEPTNCSNPGWTLGTNAQPWDTISAAGYWQDGLTQFYGDCSQDPTSGSQNPRTGQGSVGIPVYGTPASTDVPHESRGYPNTPLTQPLVAGQIYQVSYWVRGVYDQLGMTRTTQGPGVLFVNNLDELNINNLFVIEDSRAMYNSELISYLGGWVQVCIRFEARGDERILILGNFRPNSGTPNILANPGADPNSPFSWSYYLIDDIILIPYDEDFRVLPDEAEICPDEEITLTVPSNLNGVWEDGTTDTSRTIDGIGMYSLTYQYGGCPRTEEIEVTVVNCRRCPVYLPSAFSPNHDGLNDEWKPQFECDVLEYRVDIFDRMGNLMFRSSDINEAWKPDESVQAGTYVTRIRMTYELFGEREWIDRVSEITVLR